MKTAADKDFTTSICIILSDRHLLEMIHDRPELMNRLNAAYTKNLVFKDSFGVGQGGAGVDQKRVLDLSPQRLALIQAYDDKILTGKLDS